MGEIKCKKCGHTHNTLTDCPMCGPDSIYAEKPKRETCKKCGYTGVPIGGKCGVCKEREKNRGW